MEQNLRTPGPTPIPQAVRDAQAMQMVDHRGTEFAELLRETSSGLAELIGTTGEVLLLTGSGSGALEAAVVNTLSPGDRVLSVIIGSFGDRFAKIASAFGADVDPLPFEWGTPADAASVRERLATGGPYRPCWSRTTRPRPGWRTRWRRSRVSSAPLPATRCCWSTASAGSARRLSQDGPDRVLVEGIEGRPRPTHLKISATYLAGYKALGQLTVSGPRAVEKAKLCAEIVWKRLERAGVTFPPEERTVELVGTGVCLPGILPPPEDPPEVVLRLGVRDEDREKVTRFGKEIAPLVTSMGPAPQAQL